MDELAVPALRMLGNGRMLLRGQFRSSHCTGRLNGLSMSGVRAN